MDVAPLHRTVLVRKHMIVLFAKGQYEAPKNWHAIPPSFPSVSFLTPLPHFGYLFRSHLDTRRLWSKSGSPIDRFFYRARDEELLWNTSVRTSCNCARILTGQAITGMTIHTQSNARSDTKTETLSDSSPFRPTRMMISELTR